MALAGSIPYLWLARKLLEHDPNLLPSPGKILRILCIITKGVLLDFANTATDNVLDRFFDSLATTHFVDELKIENVNGERIFG